MNKDYNYYLNNISLKLKLPKELIKNDVLTFYNKYKDIYEFDELLNVNCIDCINSFCCINCDNCRYCVNCENCENCKRCIINKDCKNLFDCYDCKYCVNCVHMEKSEYYYDNMH